MTLIQKLKALGVRKTSRSGRGYRTDYPTPDPVQTSARTRRERKQKALAGQKLLAEDELKYGPISDELKAEVKEKWRKK